MSITVRSLLCVAACLALVVPTGASAASCTAGPAATASSDRPHLVDVGGDLTTGVWPGGPGAYDLSKVWVSQVDEPAAGKPATFAVNLVVGDLTQHPVNAAFYVNYSPTEWVAAKASVDGTWRFSWGQHPASGPVIGAAYREWASTTGSIDATRGVISITLPTENLPQPPTDGREVLLEQLHVRSGSALGAPGTAQPELLATADSSTNASQCAVVLYPAKPEPAA